MRFNKINVISKTLEKLLEIRARRVKGDLHLVAYHKCKMTKN